MAVVASIRIGAAVAEVEFTVNASGTVTGIVVRSTLPRAIRVYVRHAGSGYVFEDPSVSGLGRELVLTTPLTISLPNPRRFPDDGTADVRISTDVRSVTAARVAKR